MKKLLTALLALTLLAGCAGTPAEQAPEGPAPLPAPQDETLEYQANKDDAEKTKCAIGVYNPACSSINSSNLKEYLGREDVLYIDLRDYTDFATTHLRNFEVVPYFALIFNENANGADLPQLYSGSVTEPVATYEESDDLLEAFFPKDKTLFLMCQSGGRVGKLMQLLEAKGYDMSKVYNIGGMAQYATSEYTDMTTQSGEVVANVTYSFDGLTLAK